MKIKYEIDGVLKKFSVPLENKFYQGNDVVLSNKNTDSTYEQPWYNLGYTVKKVFSKTEFSFIKENIKNTLKKTLKNQGISVNNFELENYHRYIKNNEDHYKVVSKTSDLFDNDFDNSIVNLHDNLSKILGLKLSSVNPKNGKVLHIIVRIVRPFSLDYNPPHKDMYESIDRELEPPSIVNFWIPICGLSNKTSLPLVPKSHLINEKEIYRTRTGGVFNNQNYRVRLIKKWGENNRMIRPKMNYGDTLIFSSYLIHGLGTNEQDDITRMSLEFRLFEAK